jgi:hypothetical protein
VVSDGSPLEAGAVLHGARRVIMALIAVQVSDGGYGENVMKEDEVTEEGVQEETPSASGAGRSGSHSKKGARSAAPSDGSTLEGKERRSESSLSNCCHAPTCHVKA